MVTLTQTIKVSETSEIILSFDTLADAIAGQTGTAKFIQIGDAKFEYDAAGTALTTADGRKWKIKGDATPAHFGAVADGATDDSAALIAWATYCGTSGKGLWPDGQYLFDAANAQTISTTTYGFGDASLKACLIFPAGVVIETEGTNTQLIIDTPTAAETCAIAIAEPTTTHAQITTTIGKFTLRAKGAHGRYGIVTPAVANLFANKRPRYELDVNFAPPPGQDDKTIAPYGWAYGIKLGDFRTAKVRYTGFGTYNATAADAGQHQMVGCGVDATVGAYGLDLEFVASNMRTFFEGGDGLEGFILRNYEGQGGWIGVNLNSSGVEPGGFIDNGHLNCNKYGIQAANRASLQIGAVEAYRSDSYDDHGGEWAGVFLGNCSKVSIQSIHAIHGTLLTKTSSYMLRANSSTFTLDTWQSDYLAAAIRATDCKDSAGGSGQANQVDVIHDLYDTSGAMTGMLDYTAGEVMNRAGTIQYFRTDGNVDKKRLRFPANSLLSVRSYQALTLSAAGSTTVKPRETATEFLATQTAGSGAYTYDFILDRASAVPGDAVKITLVGASSSNPTVRLCDNSTGTVLKTVNYLPVNARMTLRAVFNESGTWSFLEYAEAAPAIASVWGLNGRQPELDMWGTSASAMQAALNSLSGTGLLLHLRRGNSYTLNTMITVPAGTGIEGNGATIVPGMSTTDITADRVSAGAVVLYAAGELSGAYTPLDGVTLRNFTIANAQGDTKVLNGIVLRNVKDPNVKDIEFTGSGLYKCLRVDSASGRGVIRRITGRDITPATALAGATGSNAQITLVEVDQGRVNSVSSDGLIVKGVWGKSMKQTGALLTAITSGAAMVQSDVVNLQFAQRCEVWDLYGEDSGEVLDITGSFCTGGNIRGKNNWGSEIKFVHGAQHNKFFGVTSEGQRYQAVSFSAGNTQDTAYNEVHAVSVKDLDPLNELSALYTTAAVRFLDNGASAFNSHSNAVYGLDADCGTYGKFVATCDAPSTGNVVEGVRVISGGTAGNYNNAGGEMLVREKIPTLVHAYRSTTQAVSSATLTKIQFDTEISDRRGEYDNATNYRWTCTVPGAYTISSQFTLNTASAGYIQAKLNGSTVIAKNEDTGASYAYGVTLAREFAAGDYVEIEAYQSSGGALNIQNGENRTFFSVVRN